MLAEASESRVDPIKHVVVLILENRSFDQMLGCFKQIYNDLEGVDPANPRTNFDINGRQFSQQATTLRQMPWQKPNIWDPHHEVPHVRTQIEGEDKSPARMSGFVFDFSD